LFARVYSIRHLTNNHFARCCTKNTPAKNAFAECQKNTLGKESSKKWQRKLCLPDCLPSVSFDTWQTYFFHKCTFWHSAMSLRVIEKKSNHILKQ
jgi:hypothetical protein